MYIFTPHSFVFCEFKTNVKVCSIESKIQFYYSDLSHTS